MKKRLTNGTQRVYPERFISHQLSARGVMLEETRKMV